MNSFSLGTASRSLEATQWEGRVAPAQLCAHLLHLLALPRLLALGILILRK